MENLAQTAALKEVSLSVGFNELYQLGRDQLDHLWETEYKDKLPRDDQKPPFTPLIEQIDGASVPVPSATPLTNVRRWFMSSEGNEVLQVQRNWFAHNWRRTGVGVTSSSELPYPGYKAIRNTFSDSLEMFVGYIDKEELGSFSPLQCEVSFVHHIPSGDIWNGPEDLSNVLRMFSASPEEKLPGLEGMRLITKYLMPGPDGEPRGRLYGGADTAFSTDGKPSIILTFFARGLPSEDTVKGVTQFLDIGQEWVVEGFQDFLTPGILQSLS